MPASPEARTDLARRFGENLRRARRRAGLPQEELAVLASLHRTEVSMLERGIRVPRLDTMVRLLGSLEAEPSDLFIGMRWTVGGQQEGSFAIGTGPAETPSGGLAREPLRAGQ